LAYATVDYGQRVLCRAFSKQRALIYKKYVLNLTSKNLGAFFPAFLKAGKNRAIRSYENASVFIPLLSLAR
jgi:hypothetical protein